MDQVGPSGRMTHFYLEGDQFVEFCSLPKRFRSFPSEMTKLPLRMLTHTSVNHNVS